MNAVLLQPAFTDPVLDAQRSFRVALKALAGPGVIQALPARHQPPALQGLDAATHALCLTLLDLDTPVWLASAFDTPAIRANLSFHCGSPIVADRKAARFALLDGPAAQDLEGFDTGNDRYPDQSCTLLIQLPSLEGGPEMSCVGPGIERQNSVKLPLDERFWNERESRNEFPCGLDMFFVSGNQMLGLPRSTRVQECA
ncbi:Carbon-phosphorus lyase complex subunit [Pseudomonas tremae]|uniref:Carbon-phosphorus lyase complex subunit n=1 Tax=Pseudomonas tremae TaxID=200454 RepID=A0AA40P0J0_9PSED|nr:MULTISPECIES: phosphonate C-P lyase system protein PhnH [Pseudomonas syringae group]KPY92759.1 Carbon-phosphorus lyase complex subunit [Pseudomonas tremae]RMO06014.1 Carbon-phosphorus lyase complex subunit [Pseudomonas coronafaciens pv. zizaniae]